MKHPFRAHILPYFPLAAGVVGLCLRLWLFSAMDEKGLLPARHFADSALYILTAVTLGVLFLATRDLTARTCSKKVYRFSGVIGCVLGGIGLIAAALMNNAAIRLAGISTVASLLGSVAMFLMAALRFARKKIPYLLNAALTVVLMLDTVAQCQIWGTVPQLQVYFFPLLAAVFLILSAYQATVLSAGKGKPDLLAFFSQGALFLCCLSLNTQQWPLYLGMLFWAGSLFYSCIHTKKEA